MGRRSRKRRIAPAAAPRTTPESSGGGRGGSTRAAPRSYRARLAEAPKAPWSPFPLVEISILAGLVILVIGFLTDDPERRGAFLAGGTLLVSLAGLELSIREHFAGFRSHSALLAGAVALVVVVPLAFLTRLPQEALLAVGVIAYTLGFALLRRAFKVRAGGVSFRV
jgi:hypothetical protein